MFRPVDTLSRKSRESGPVRAQGRSKQPVDGQPSPNPRSPHSNHPAALEHFERPVKRQRRDISSPASSSAVIDLVNDEDGKLRSPLLLSPQAPRQHRLSSTSSQSSSRARRPTESRNDVDEYRGVEKLMSTAYRRNSKYNLQRKQESLADESSPRNIRQRRPQSPLLDDGTASARLDSGSRPSILDSVEIYNSGNGIQGRSLKESPTLQKQFVPTNGRRRTADMRESPDELQGEATVRPTPMSLSFPKNRDPTSESRSADRSGKDMGKDTRSISPSDIQPTTFSRSRQGHGKKQQKSRKLVNSKSHLHLFEASFFRMGPLERIASQEEAFEVSFDDNNGTIELQAPNDTGPTVIVSIPVKKISQALQGVNGSRKVRLKLSKMEGSSDAEIDMEFRTEKDKDDLCGLLETKGVPTWKKQR
jgi:sentrin-specific protease 7